MIGNAKAIIQYLFEQQDTNRLYEIKEKRNRRSITQNSYYWALLNNLASVLKMDNQQLHFMMLKRYGTYEVISVRSDIDVQGYFRYYEPIGHGTVNGTDFTHYRIYKGSSQMDSKEFSRLLEGVRSECEEMGLPTMTPDEISQLRFIEGR